jgi:PiT family inorganic phosphate transporter
MIIWAFSLSIWLAVFGKRLIQTVWNEITKLDQIKAYCVALSAAITVIVASAMSLPVSTTQIAIGWVFWIGLYREFLNRKKDKNKVIIKKSMIKSIILSWIITLPISAVLSSITYLIVIAVSN